MKANTVNAIERFETLVREMKKEGIDPLFIYAALRQVAADIEPEANEFAKNSKKPDHIHLT